jgi:host factor-I protein
MGGGRTNRSREGLETAALGVGRARHCSLRAGRAKRSARPQQRRLATSMSADKKQNLQDIFLNAVRKGKTPLTVFLVNGVKLQGIVTWFDNFCVLLKGEGRPPQLVYKHAISTIAPNAPVNLFENEDED